jgi:recombinational DNA repair protein RecT
MPDGSGAPRENGLLQVVYWRQGDRDGVEEHARKYVYRENLTWEEAWEVSGKLDRSLNASY